MVAESLCELSGHFFMPTRNLSRPCHCLTHKVNHPAVVKSGFMIKHQGQLKKSIDVTILMQLLETHCVRGFLELILGAIMRLIHFTRAYVEY